MASTPLWQNQLSEAQTAALLHLDRWESLEVMGRYRVPAMRRYGEHLRLVALLPQLSESGMGHVREALEMAIEGADRQVPA